MRSAMVSGASGFIGSYLTKRLLEEGVKVYGIGTSRKKLDDLRFEGDFVPIVADFRSYDSLERYIDDEEIDVFYHMAWEGGFTSALKDHKLQYKNSKAACDAIVSASKMKSVKKFVYAGTVNQMEIYQFLYKDDFIPRNNWVYASTKVAADMICRTLAYNYGMEYCCALIPLLYGVGNASPQLINIVIKNCYSGTPSKLIKGDNKYDIVHVSDVVEGLYRIGTTGKNMRSYYIGHRSLNTFREVVENIRDAINPEAELKFGEYPESLNLDYSSIDLECLYKDTGFECGADFVETIREQADWLKTIGF